ARLTCRMRQLPSRCSNWSPRSPACSTPWNASATGPGRPTRYGRRSPTSSSRACAPCGASAGVTKAGCSAPHRLARNPSRARSRASTNWKTTSSRQRDGRSTTTEEKAARLRGYEDMKYRYSRFVADLADEIDLDTLVSRLSDLLLSSGFDNPWDPQSDDDRTLQALHDA